MTHDHDHTHDDTAAPEGPPTHFQIMEIALRELLLEKGVLSAEEVRREVEAMEARTPATGARLVARAWVDPAFKARLLADTRTAAAELGIEAGPYRILTMENTPQTHNLIVCTLCSCYPRILLGIPPAWYKGTAYRARAAREPRAVMAEFGLVLPEGTAVRVHDSTADMRYMVLPLRPAGTDAWDEVAPLRPRHPRQPDRCCRRRCSDQGRVRLPFDRCPRRLQPRAPLGKVLRNQEF